MNKMEAAEKMATKINEMNGFAKAAFIAVGYTRSFS